MSALFITRELTVGSVLHQWAQQNDYRIIARSLLRFARVPFQVPDDCQWWFFYSPRAVDFAADKLALCPWPLPRLAAMGTGTARALQQHPYGLSAEFVGEGSPVAVAEAFGARADGMRVFFPHARQSRKTVQSLLATRIDVRAAVCYDNQAVTQPSPVSASIYVFTSPLNVRAYLTAHTLDPDVRILAIGPSTAQALASFGIRAEVAEQSSEAGLVALLEK